MKKIILISLLIAILSISAVAAEDNTTNTLNDVNDSPKTFSELQTKIDQADKGDVVEVNGTHINTGYQLVIEKQITLKGCEKDTILDANNCGSMMEINAPNTILINLKFIDAKWGAVACVHNTTFINCSFVNNHNGWDGGAIKYQKCITLINCTFINNTAVNGGAIHWDNEYRRSNTQNTYIENCVFINNSAMMEGGAINAWTSTDKATTYIKNSKFISCAAGRGGAIYGSNLNLKNTIFDKNRAEARIYDGVLFEGSSSAILTQGKSIKIDNCSFTNNVAKMMGVIEMNVNGEFKNTKFINNTAKYFACFISTNNKITLNNCTLSNNKARYIGGVGTVAGELKFINCNFKNNINGTISNIEGKTIVTKNGKTKTYAIGVYNDQIKAAPILKVIFSDMALQVKEKLTVKVKVVDAKTNKPIKSFDLNLKLYRNNKLLSNTHGHLNSQGVATFYLYTLKTGTYKLSFDHIVYGYPLVLAVKKTTNTLKVVKQKPLDVSAPEVTHKFKKTQYFKITVKNGKTPVKNTYVKVKIDSKTYQIKTDSKGIAKYNTKNLKVGKHNVVVSSGNSKYYMYAKSSITIKR